MRSLLLPGPYASCTKMLYPGPPGVVEASQRSSGGGAVGGGMYPGTFGDGGGGDGGGAT